MSRISVACVQFAVVKSDRHANLAKVLSAIQAAAGSADLLLLPEMWYTGFAFREMKKFADETPAVLQEIGRAAGEAGLAVVGSLAEADAGSLFNTSFVVDNSGQMVASYRKIHLFPGFKEDMFLMPGAHPVVFKLKGFRVGLAICFDLRFPELFRKLAIMGADLALVSAQWPAEREEHWRVLLRARAVENQICLAGANAVGSWGPTTFGGLSAIVDPAGLLLAEADGTSEMTITASLDLERISAVRGPVNYLACRAKDADEFLVL